MPSTTESLLAFVDEIKNRGRVCVSSGDLRSADALYGRGIDALLHLESSSGIGMGGTTSADLAILRSNRSLVRLRMGMSSEALDDARQASEDDPTYVKAHWRMGQAAMAIGDTSGALVSFEKALVLEPNNKALRKEVDMARERLAKEEESMDMAAASAAVEYDDVGGAKVDAKSTTIEEPKQRPENQQPTSSSSKEQVVVDDSEFTKSDHVRGYKIRSDGKKTSFFDREISDDARKLIGDIAPKKLDAGGIVDGGGGGNVGSGPMPVATEGTSAWNKAGEYI